MKSYPKHVREAYDQCRTIALGHYENFPVGSILLPKRVRPHFFALYAFMRTADDFADLTTRTSTERLAELASWRLQLSATFRQEISDAELHPIFLALRYTVREHSLSIEPFNRLLDAFEFDARGEVRFETFSDLLWYCNRSADPVGELVLRLFGYQDAERIALSNEICSGLQLLNFCQDVQEDLEQGRCYFAHEDLRQLGIGGMEGLRDPVNARKAVIMQMAHVERLIASGAPLTEMVSGRLRYELRAVVFGAIAMMGKLREIGGNSYEQRPKFTKAEHLLILFKSLLSRPDPEADFRKQSLKP